MKTLLAYSSGYGATKEISDRIASILRRDNLEVDVKPIDALVSIDDYDTLIIGTTIRADKIVANVRDFIARNVQGLTQKNLVIFSTSLTAHDRAGREKVKESIFDQISTRYPKLKPVTVEAFGGKIDLENLNPVMQSYMKSVMKDVGLPAEGSIDTRDWQYIDAWANHLRKQLRLAA